MKCLNFVVDFFTEATASASVASMEATPLFIIMVNLQYNKQFLPVMTNKRNVSTIVKILIFFSFCKVNVMLFKQYIRATC